MQTIKVWDIWVRFTHWSVAGIVIFNVLNEEGSRNHRYAGYIALGLVVLRILWGFVGSRYARFSEWLPSMTALSRYTRAKKNGASRRYIGHNPLGAMMILLLWGLIVFQGVSGYLMGTDMFFGSEFLEEAHELAGNAFIPAVILHVLAAVWESLRTKENLIASMIHGRKRAPAVDDFS